MVGMPSKQFLSFVFGCALAVALPASSAPAQQEMSGKLPPAKLSPTPDLLLDAVVTQQWPATLPLVNPPVSLEYLSPGQCIRVGAVVYGEGHKALIAKVKIGFTVHYGILDQSFPTEAPLGIKQMKPEGGDFVTAALAAGGVKAPDMSMASMAGSAGKWCVPDGAQGGTVKIDAAVTVDGKPAKMKPVEAEIDAPGKTAAPFKSALEANDWMQRYHFAPRPAFLAPATQLILPYLVQNPGGVPTLQAFLAAALKQNPAAAARLGPALTASNKMTRVFMMDLLDKDGIQLNQPPTLGGDEKQVLSQAPALTDPFDMTPTPELFSKLDMLWSNFAATGRIEPIQAITSALAWRADYDAFVQMKKEGKKPAELNDSEIRALAYMAAGWSLGSFQQSDGLAADYIQAIEASPNTPAAVKKELAGLQSNPAFQRPNGK